MDSPLGVDSLIAPLKDVSSTTQGPKPYFLNFPMCVNQDNVSSHKFFWFQDQVMVLFLSLFLGVHMTYRQ